MTPALFIDLPYDTSTVLIIVVILLGATSLSVVAGFGLGTIAVPMLLVMLPPAAVVAIIKVASLGTGWIVLLSIWRYIQWRTIVRILPAAFAGLLVGGYILNEANPAVIQLGVGVLVLISAITLVMRPILIARDSVWATSLVGFLTGVMGNSTGLLAPAAVVYFTGRRFPRDAFRASTITLFLSLDVVGLPTLVAQGAVSWSHLQFALLLAPVAITGRLLGLRLVRFVSQLVFRRLVMALLFVMALLSIVSAVEGL